MNCRGVRVRFELVVECLVDRWTVGQGCGWVWRLVVLLGCSVSLGGPPTANQLYGFQGISES